MACHRVTLGSSVVIWLMIPCGLPQGSSLEDVFKVIKGTFSLGKLHRFTLASVTKIASLGVVLAAISISLGFGDKESLQKLAEW